MLKKSSKFKPTFNIDKGISHTINSFMNENENK